MGVTGSTRVIPPEPGGCHIYVRTALSPPDWKTTGECHSSTSSLSCGAWDRESEPEILVLQDLQQCKWAEGVKYLDLMSDFVSNHKNKTLIMRSPDGARLRIAGLEDTIYKGKDDEVNGWGKFYLPEIVTMKVIGVLEGTSCPCKQLVLMTCEDKKLYAYDGEELHLVAPDFEQLCDKEINYPASVSYYNGEAFKDMNKKHWKKVKRGALGRKLKQEHQKLVKENKEAFLKSLKS